MQEAVYVSSHHCEHDIVGKLRFIESIEVHVLSIAPNTDISVAFSVGFVHIKMTGSFNFATLSCNYIS
jgi:hypothetical protein